MDTKIRDKYNYWITSDFIDSKDKIELEKIKDNEKEIIERFYTDLTFGTGGLRGIRGIGTNRINKYNICKTTQGLAEYIIENGSPTKGVVIAYDSRIGSREYAENASLVLAGNGIKVYLFESLRSTPELSFALREYQAQSGIVITASHNPKEYNGYKVYWDDGSQIVEPHASGIIEKINLIDNFEKINILSKEKAISKNLLEIIGEEVDRKYIEVVKKISFTHNINYDLKMVYTPLHGTGKRPVEILAKEKGFNNFYIVPEQAEGDGNFPTVSYANPEDENVFKLGIELAEKKGSKIVLATDPDADRIGFALKNRNGKWEFPTGNEIGMLLLEYIIKNSKNIPSNATVVSTIVSTPMIDIVSKKNNLKVIKTLTGFKYIGEKIKEFEEGKIDGKYLFGFEESVGYLPDIHVRDKDGVATTLLIMEMAAHYDKISSDLLSELDKLYKKYGFYRTDIKSLVLKGKEGKEKILNIMKLLRSDPPIKISDKKVVILRDYSKKIEKNLITIEENDLKLPKSNVLQFVLEDDSYITVRPSGTEPKIKYYFGINGKTADEADKKLKTLIEDFSKIVN